MAASSNTSSKYCPIVFKTHKDDRHLPQTEQRIVALSGYMKPDGTRKSYMYFVINPTDISSGKDTIIVENPFIREGADAPDQFTVHRNSFTGEYTIEIPRYERPVVSNATPEEGDELSEIEMLRRELTQLKTSFAKLTAAKPTRGGIRGGFRGGRGGFHHHRHPEDHEYSHDNTSGRGRRGGFRGGRGGARFNDE